MKKRINRKDVALAHYLRWLLGSLNVYQPLNYQWTGSRQGKVLTIYSPDKRCAVLIDVVDDWTGCKYMVYANDFQHLLIIKDGPGASDQVRVELNKLWRETHSI